MFARRIPAASAVGAALSLVAASAVAQPTQPVRGTSPGDGSNAPTQSSLTTPATPSPSAPDAAEHDPIGAVSTPAGAHRLVVRPGLDVIGQYALRITEEPSGTAWFHRFDLTRAHAALTATWGPARARVVLEAVRSASEGALLGVAGDSLLLRVREGYAAWRPWSWLEGQAGVVPTLTIPPLESAWGGRALAPASLESTGLSSPADLGLTVRARLPRGLGVAAIGAYNGEGYALRELNRGKNLELAAELRPLATLGLPSLVLLGSYVMGSSGTGRSRADRLTAGVLFDRPRLGLGASATIAWGVADASDRTSVLVEGFARAEPLPRWLLSARASWWNRDLSRGDDTLLTLLFGVGARLSEPLTAWIAVARAVAGPATQSSIPGSDHWELRAVTRAVF